MIQKDHSLDSIYDASFNRECNYMAQRACIRLGDSCQFEDCRCPCKFDSGSKEPGRIYSIKGTNHDICSAYVVEISDDDIKKED